MMHNGSNASPLLDAITSYGIVSRHVFERHSILRRIVTGCLLLLQLGLVYAGVWYATAALWPDSVAGEDFVSSLLAAVLTALAVAPANTIVQNLSHRLFSNIHQLDFEVALKAANQLFRSINTTPELLEKFAGLLKSSCGTDRVFFLAAQKPGLLQIYPETTAPIIVRESQTLYHTLLRNIAPFSLTALRRRRAASPGQEVLALMKSLQTEAFVAAMSKNKPACVVLLGQRLNGTAYNPQELEALQILAQQFAGALENATLYTEVRNSNAYSGALLDQLVTGVIAADASGDITVCNREARRLLGVEPDEILGRPVSFLPHVLEKFLEEALDLERGCRDVSAILPRSGGTDIPISISTRAFSTDGAAHIGAVLVFQDLSQIRALEEQVRRADRLATLGTLSASVVHEVKNPLVAIKTFVQLLPERIHDTAFLEAFSSLVGDEIKRIDKIINQFLGLGGTEKTTQTSVRLHEALEVTLNLLHHDFIKRKVRVTSSFQAADDRLMASAQKLQQVLLNLLMNALEAMSDGGSIIISTRNVEADLSENRRSHIEIRIEDSGPGIPEEMRRRIFDPFFTTKEKGTGLGLSICQNIVSEYGGKIEIPPMNHPGGCVAITFPNLETTLLA